MIVLSKIFTLVMCHLVGDYVLQNDFIAKTKGENIYHLFVHSMLYCLPFALLFGISIEIYLLMITHILIDYLKAKLGSISYLQDQLLHYLVLATLFLQ